MEARPDSELDLLSSIIAVACDIAAEAPAKSETHRELCAALAQARLSALRLAAEQHVADKRRRRG